MLTNKTVLNFYIKYHVGSNVRQCIYKTYTYMILLTKNCAIFLNKFLLRFKLQSKLGYITLYNIISYFFNTFLISSLLPKDTTFTYLLFIDINYKSSYQISSRDFYTK